MMRTSSSRSCSYVKMSVFYACLQVSSHSFMHKPLLRGCFRSPSTEVEGCKSAAASLRLATRA